MLVSEYDAFVQRTDQSIHLPDAERQAVAIYGLASEIGSVVAALKKRFLGSGGISWNAPDEELIEELGDVMWYCFSLARLANERHVNIFVHDIANLRRQLSANDDLARTIAAVLDPEEHRAFLTAAEGFSSRTRGMHFEDYQDLAFLTARTHGQDLLRVCVAVLWQLSAQLLRETIPAIEQQLNREVLHKPLNDILGETAWHISAIASLFGLKLSDIAEFNREKISLRWDRTVRTPLHDEGLSPAMQFPREFEIAFLPVAPGRSRMYFEGRRLGDDLTDNAYSDDGYRFHDVMHLANAAVLGWSPVLRSLMGRKRKHDVRIDEIEDGARARIVEEAVIKAVHSEGQRLARRRGETPEQAPTPLLESSADIGFSLLKLIAGFVRDLEVSKNRFSEWESAILQGHNLFHRLRREGQGTVTVDLNNRRLDFSPRVFVPLRGRVAGLGSATLSGRPQVREGIVDPDRDALAKSAILDALGLSATAQDMPSDLHVTVRSDDDLVSVKAGGAVQAAMWDRGILAFRVTYRDGQALAVGLTDD